MWWEWVPTLLVQASFVLTGVVLIRRRARARAPEQRRAWPVVLAWGLGAAALLYGGTWVAGALYRPLRALDDAQLVKTALSFGYMAPMALTGAVAEEILFRGALLPRFGLLLSSLAFGLVHLTAGIWLHVVWAVAAGLVFGVVYQRAGLRGALLAHLTANALHLVGAAWWLHQRGMAL